MTRILKTILVFTGAISLVFLFMSCESDQPEPTVTRVVKRPIKPEEIPFDPATKWKSPIIPPVRSDQALFPEPYPDLNRIIEDAPSWDGGLSIWAPVSEAPETRSAQASVQPDVKTAPAPETAPGPYVLLLGTFTRKNYADLALAQFQDRGLAVFLDRFTYKKRRYYGIFYGGYPDTRQARQAGKALTQQGKVEEFYVRKRPETP